MKLSQFKRKYNILDLFIAEKHPVTLLKEYCRKRKFEAPVYELCFESGPDHKKNFMFKVIVDD